MSEIRIDALLPGEMAQRAEYIGVSKAEAPTINTFDLTFTASTGLDLTNLTWSSFFIANLLPVSIGNIIGGAVLVAPT